MATILIVDDLSADRKVLVLFLRDVTVKPGLRPEPAFVTADRGQVEQIVLNLVVNARMPCREAPR
jgi:signal transduction histidine kinase